jgi:hypothetical protein
LARVQPVHPAPYLTHHPPLCRHKRAVRLLCLTCSSVCVLTNIIAPTATITATLVFCRCCNGRASQRQRQLARNGIAACALTGGSRLLSRRAFLATAAASLIILSRQCCLVCSERLPSRVMMGLWCMGRNGRRWRAVDCCLQAAGHLTTKIMHKLCAPYACNSCTRAMACSLHFISHQREAAHAARKSRSRQMNHKLTDCLIHLANQCLVCESCHCSMVIHLACSPVPAQANEMPPSATISAPAAAAADASSGRPRCCSCCQVPRAATAPPRSTSTRSQRGRYWRWWVTSTRVAPYSVRACVRACVSE